MRWHDSIPETFLVAHPVCRLRQGLAAAILSQHSMHSHPKSGDSPRLSQSLAQSSAECPHARGCAKARSAGRFGKKSAVIESAASKRICADQDQECNTPRPSMSAPELHRGQHWYAKRNSIPVVLRNACAVPVANAACLWGLARDLSESMVLLSVPGSWQRSCGAIGPAVG